MTKSASEFDELSQSVLYQLHTSFTSFEEFARRRGVGYHMPKMARATMATESDSPMRLNSTRRAKKIERVILPLSDSDRGRLLFRFFLCVLFAI